MTSTHHPVDTFLAEISEGAGIAIALWTEDVADQVHLITVDGARISRDTVFCGGRWPAGLLAEMEAARGN